ncbi:MAG: chorismate synthase [Bacteriovoracaceae bacterium]|nr:chorismate synthase [Bacteriovoracaceae bacterium]
MRGNTFGKLFSFCTFGESHGPAMGVVIDGMPSNVKIDLKKLKLELEKRAPGRSATTSSRQEPDEPIVLSGIFENKTLGTPIAIIIENKNQNSQDYEKYKKTLRPGHADETTVKKFGIRDHRGGGRASGRETVSRVIAGYFAGLILPKMQVNCYVSQLGPFKTDLAPKKDLGPFQFPDKSQWEAIEKFLLDCKTNGNSVGGTINVHIKNPPAGLGEPAFDKLKADLAKAMISIGSCVGFTYGIGEDFKKLDGKTATTKKKNFGGIEGGISNGDDIYCQVWFRAPSTVGQMAQEGRHDPCILPRVVPVVAAMCKVVLADHYLRQKAYQ